MISFVSYKNIPRSYFFFITVLLVFLNLNAETHYLSLRGLGRPKYDRNFSHFSYVNPKAPKGGDLNLATSKRFNQRNPYADSGVPTPEAHHVFATLMKVPRDNMEVAYPYLAKSVMQDPKNKWVCFSIRKTSRFHNGQPITPDDVLFSFETIKKKGPLSLRSFYKGVKRVELVGSDGVKFVFHEPDPDLPYQLGLLPVFSKASMKGKDWTKESALLGSGPYKVRSYAAGKFVVYERIRNWWGANLPCNKGFYNFNTIKVTYYADSKIAFEAFKKGLVDYWTEEGINNWFNGYNFQAVKRGDVKRLSYKKPFYHGLTGLFINTRRPPLADHRVREALNLLFDFDWLNKARFFNSYKRNKSIFMNSGYGASDSFTKEEKKIASLYETSHLPKRLFDPLKDNEPKNFRMRLDRAIILLKEAGWILKDGRLIHAKTKEPMILDLVVFAPGHVLMFQDFIRKLERAGIECHIKGVDMAYYLACRRELNFDMILSFHPHVVIPGPEQNLLWGSAWAKPEGTLNLAGVQDPVVDDLVAKIKTTRSLKTLKAYTSLLDRIITLGCYLIPGWTPSKSYVAYWKKLNFLMQDASLYDTDTWWMGIPEKKAF